MVCLTPITVRRYQDDEAKVPCGKCAACRANYRAQWITRVRCELLSSKFSVFVTLTYDDDHIKFDDYYNIYTSEIVKKPFCDKRDIQLFLKRFRKYGYSVRYYFISEYGEKTLRPHWHGILFFDKDFTQSDKIKLYDIVVEKWQNGNVFFGEATIASITYITKYLLKDSDKPLDIDDNRMLCSRKPPIGSVVINSYKDSSDGNINSFSYYGTKAALPRLFKDKWKKDLTEEQIENNDLSLHDKILQNQLKLENEYNSNFKDRMSFHDFLLLKSKSNKVKQSNYSKHNKL